MAYFRFKRQYLVADEVHICNIFLADVLGDNGKKVMEIECKTSKSDLRADSKKEKHRWYKEVPEKYAPNQFYICVPTNLVADAIQWTNEINPNYGVIELSETKFEHWINYTRGWENMLYFAKKAKSLHTVYKSKQERIGLRLASKVINSSCTKLYHSYIEDKRKNSNENLIP